MWCICLSPHFFNLHILFCFTYKYNHQTQAEHQYLVLCASSWSFHLETCYRRCSCHQSHYDLWSHHPGTWSQGWLGESLIPCSQIPSRQYKGPGNFLSMHKISLKNIYSTTLCNCTIKQNEPSPNHATATYMLLFTFSLARSCNLLILQNNWCALNHNLDIYEWWLVLSISTF